MKTALPLIALILTLAPCMVSANPEASHYLKSCEAAKNQESASPDDSKRLYQEAYCLGVTQGTIQTLRFMNDFIPRKRRLCLQEDAQASQLLETILKFNKEHPAAARLGVAHLVREAIMEAYPCPTTINNSF